MGTRGSTPTRHTTVQNSGPGAPVGSVLRTGPPRALGSFHTLSHAMRFSWHLRDEGSRSHDPILKAQKPTSQEGKAPCEVRGLRLGQGPIKAAQLQAPCPPVPRRRLRAGIETRRGGRIPRTGWEPSLPQGDVSRTGHLRAAEPQGEGLEVACPSLPGCSADSAGSRGHGQGRALALPTWPPDQHRANWHSQCRLCAHPLRQRRPAQLQRVGPPWPVPTWAPRQARSQAVPPRPCLPVPPRA